MAITPSSLRLIMKAGGSGRAAAAGYPDLLLSQALVEGASKQPIPIRVDSEKIIQWHGVNLPVIYESTAFFRAIGYELDVFDIAQIRGGEIIVDLNFPMDGYRCQYDLVIDAGTCEHCFNVGQAIINLADLVKEGGHIVQVFPLNAYNHGFYSISPTLVKDFYEDNGFEIVECFGLQNKTYAKFPVDYRKRFTGVPENSFIQLLAKRVEVKPITYPTQHKYR